MATAREVLGQWARIPRPEGPGWAEPGSVGKAGTKTDMLRGFLSDERILQLATGEPAPWPIGNKHLTPLQQDQLRAVATRMIPFVEQFMVAIGNAAELTDRLCDNPLADRAEAHTWARDKGRGRRQPFSRDALIDLLDVDPPEAWIAYWDDGLLPRDEFDAANRFGIEKTAQAHAAGLDYFTVVAAAPDEEYEQVLRDLDAIKPARTLVTAQALRESSMKELGKLSAGQMWPVDLWGFIRELARMLRDPDDIDPEVVALYGLWAENGLGWVYKSKLKMEVDEARRRALVEETHGLVGEKVELHLRRIRLGVQDRDPERFVKWVRFVVGKAARDVFNAHYEKVRDHLGNEVVDDEGQPTYRPMIELCRMSYGFGSDQEMVSDAGADPSDSPDETSRPRRGVTGTTISFETAEAQMDRELASNERQDNAVRQLVEAFAWQVTAVTDMLPGMVGPEVQDWVRSTSVASPEELQQRPEGAPAESLEEFLLYLPEVGKGSRGRPVKYVYSPVYLIRDMSRACHAFLKSQGVGRVSAASVERVFIAAWERAKESGARNADHGEF